MKTKFFKDIAEEIESNSWQMLMLELDSSLNDMLYISSADLSDAYESEQFNKFFDDIKSCEAVVVSVTDDADLYEVGDDSLLIILIERYNERLMIFDKQDKRKIISKIQSYE